MKWRELPVASSLTKTPCYQEVNSMEQDVHYRQLAIWGALFASE
jgi:hypothetical protein